MTQQAWPQPSAARRRLARLGIAAHEQQFLRPVRQAVAGEAVIREDSWQGHRLHHEHLSQSVVDWADVVLAEWCLGNAVWYAKHRRPNTRLVVRFHRFELDTDFPAELDIDAVDTMVFVGPHVRDEAVERFGWPRAKCVVVPNSVDVSAFDLPKHETARFTLGLLTWHRKLKRLDLALDLLERLRADNPQYCLRVKGARPENTEHVWKYAEERDYFTEQYERIATSPLLRDAVIFDPPGPDVPEWFTRVGHILSFSDVESFHLALAEGMASGAVPVIRGRPGARELFGDAWVAEDMDEVIRAVSAHSELPRWKNAGAAAADLVRTRYEVAKVLPAWRTLLTGAQQS